MTFESNIRDDLTRVYFDLVIPYEDKRSEEEVIRLIQKKLKEPEKWEIVIRMEHPYS